MQLLFNSYHTKYEIHITFEYCLMNVISRLHVRVLCQSTETLRFNRFISNLLATFVFLFLSVRADGSKSSRSEERLVTFFFSD